MKTKLLIFSLFAFGLSFGQATINQSVTGVQPAISNPIGQQFSGQEIFRFQSGIVTQLDAGSAFDFTNSQWFGIGRVGGTPNGFNQNFYGLRFQQPNKALTMGYTSASANNPRIEWIGTGADLGDLEFRVGSGFGTPGVPGPNTLVATMTKFGNTVFGSTNPFGNASFSPRVGIVSSGNRALSVISDLTAVEVVSTGGSGLTVDTTGSGLNYSGFFNSSGGVNDTGLYAQAQGIVQSTGLEAYAVSAENNIGAKGTTFGQGGFEAGLYGESPTNGNYFAGYFDGDVSVSGTFFNPSDAKLKDNVVNEENVLERLEKLRPITYDYKKINEMNLPLQKQHGFISQELAEVFPELTKDITKPVFDRKGIIISSFEYKAINYNGLISVLTSGMLELNKEVKALKEELAEYKSNEILRNRLNEMPNTDIKGYSMDQNVPNPFTDQTQIRFQLPTNVNKASIVVFDLNGRLIKEYNLNQNSGLLNIKSSDLGKGMFLYTMVNNGSEIMTKKMIVR